MTVKKSDIVNLLADATGMNKKDVEIIVNGVLYQIIEALQNGDRVEIRGFGSFYAKERMPRKIVNPKTRKEVSVGHRFVPVFKPAKFFKESVNQKRLEQVKKEND